MQMRAEDVRDVLQAQAGRMEIVQPRLLGKVVRGRIAFVLAGAGVDQDGVPGRAREERLVGDHHAAARGIEDDRVKLRKMLAPDLWIIGREHHLRGTPRPVALDEARDGDLAELERFYERFSLRRGLRPLSYGRGVGGEGPREARLRGAPSSGPSGHLLPGGEG